MFDIKDIKSVYSGKAGRCYCGCSGKHTYAKAHQEQASKERGYTVTDDEVNDRVVKRHFNTILKASQTNPSTVELHDNLVTATIGNREITAYRKGA